MLVTGVRKERHLESKTHVHPELLTTVPARAVKETVYLALVQKGRFNDIFQLLLLQHNLGGWYCESWGLKEPTAQCPEGFYCPRGTKNGTENVCGVGFICEFGSISEQPCPAG